MSAALFLLGILIGMSVTAVAFDFARAGTLKIFPDNEMLLEIRAGKLDYILKQSEIVLRVEHVKSIYTQE